MLDRRQFLGLGSATSLGAIAPGLALEATRHGLALGLAEERADTSADEWREIVWEYGYSYISMPPQELLQSLMVDMLGLQVALERGSRSAPMNKLRQYGATLASLMAMTIANVGDVRQARRWWRTARNLAEESGDPSTIMWIRGREVVRGLYEARPTAAILQMIEQAESFANGSTPPIAPSSCLAKPRRSPSPAAEPRPRRRYTRCARSTTACLPRRSTIGTRSTDGLKTGFASLKATYSPTSGTPARQRLLRIGRSRRTPRSIGVVRRRSSCKGRFGWSTRAMWRRVLNMHQPRCRVSRARTSAWSRPGAADFEACRCRVP